MVRPARHSTTTPDLAGASSRDAASAPEAGALAAAGPIVVLSYAHGGGELLGKALAMSPGLACTKASGLLPLCHSALATWQHVEGRETPSRLAVKSVRSLVTVMSVSLQAGTGAARWAEFAYAGAAAAGSFLQVFPDAAFACVHRSLPEVIAEVSQAYPWGLGSSPLWRCAARYPGDSLAAITDYWVTCTSDLLGFEAAHPRSCIRVRDEDLASQPAHVAAILDRLGTVASPGPAPLNQDSGERGQADTEAPAAGRRPPLDQLPPQLLALASDLHAKLGYRSLQPDPGAARH